jgi:hypothetical protein
LSMPLAHFYGTMVLVLYYHWAGQSYWWHCPLSHTSLFQSSVFSTYSKGAVLMGSLESVYYIKTVAVFCKATLQMALWVSGFILS